MDLMRLEEFKPIVLTIGSVHAKRIYAGLKLYELRKVIPRRPFNIVFLYERNPVGEITGLFAPGEMLRAPPSHLWELVGEAATPRHRFDKYFSGCPIGSAIEIAFARRIPERFPPDVIPTSAGDLFRVSANFVYAADELPRRFLYFFYKRALHRPSRRVHLRGAEKQDFEAFENCLMNFIDPFYESTGKSYARQLWRSHEAESEKKGFTTLRKIVYRVEHQERLIGFVVLTFKKGGSVKSGPVVLFQEYQGQGYGKKLREAIEAVALSKGYRKVYCTVPADNKAAIHYLLSTEHKVEAHLTDHYRQHGNELVFGKILYTPSSKPLEPKLATNPDKGNYVIRKASGSKEEVEFLVETMREHFGLHYTLQHASNLIERANGEGLDEFAQKPRRVFVLEEVDRGEIHGLFICALKRSDMIKVFPLLRLGSFDIGEICVRGIECHQPSRKVIYFIPNCYGGLYRALRRLQYSVEGVLREPYCPGNDLLVLSKLAEIDPQSSSHC